MSIKNRTVFGDPSKIKLSKKEITIKITIGFKGNPATHGSFTCHVLSQNRNVQ